MDRLKALSIFKSVVGAGSFVGAAATLDLSTAAVSRTVSELEGLLGVRLLHRSTRRVGLTDVGRAILPHIDGLLESYEELSLIGKTRASHASGVVRLAAPAELGCRHLGPQLAAFRALCPDVTVDLQLLDDVSAAHHEEADLALCLTSQLRPAQIARPLARIRVGLFAAPAYLARAGKPELPAALTRHDCLTYGASRGLQTWLLRDPDTGATESVDVRGTVNSNHMDMLLEAALHGAGIVPLQLHLPLAQAGGGLQRVLASWQTDSEMLHIAYRSRRNQPMAVRRLFDHLVSSFAAPAPVLVPSPAVGSGWRMRGHAAERDIALPGRRHTVEALAA